MPRTRTTHLQTLTFPSSGLLTYPIPFSPSSAASLSLAFDSTFDSGLHWHETHTEFFRVLKGVLCVTLESEDGQLDTFYVGRGSGVVVVERRRRHRIRRGDAGKEWEKCMRDVKYREGGLVERTVLEEEVQALEWTDPSDGAKEGFFRNLCGVVGEPMGSRPGWFEGWKREVEVWAVMAEWDNYPAVLGGRCRWVEEWVVRVLFFVVRMPGRVGGFRGVCEAYTPVELWRLRGGGEVRGGGKEL